MMRAGDPRRWRLGGWRGRGRRRAGWWKGSDGRWYPPEAARHPAARGEPEAPPRPPPRRLAFAGSVWLAGLVPVTLLLAVVVAELGDTTPTDAVETFGRDADDDGAGPGDDPSAAGLPAASVQASLDSAAVAAALPGAGGAAAHTDTDTPGGGDGAAGSAAGVAADARPGAGPPGEPGPSPPAPGPAGPDQRGPAGRGPDHPGPPPGSPPASAPAPASPAPGGTPQRPDDCRLGGWQDLVDDQGRPFANQGQCLRYVNDPG